MALSDLLLSVSVQQLVQAEVVHAVEVTEQRQEFRKGTEKRPSSQRYCLLVTAVPLPGVARFTGQEVSRPLVLHPLSEPQQNPGVIV